MPDIRIAHEAIPTSSIAEIVAPPILARHAPSFPGSLPKRARAEQFGGGPDAIFDAISMNDRQASRRPPPEHDPGGNDDDSLESARAILTCAMIGSAIWLTAIALFALFR